MKKLDFRNIEFLWGVGLTVLGFILFVSIASLIRYVGIVFIILAIAFFVHIFFSKGSHSGNENFKSRTRDRIYKYQHKH